MHCSETMHLDNQADRHCTTWNSDS